MIEALLTGKGPAKLVFRLDPSDLAAGSTALVDSSTNQVPVSNPTGLAVDDLGPVAGMKSVYFPTASIKYLRLAYQKLPNIRNGDFTIRYWFKSEARKSAQCVMAQWAQIAGQGGFIIDFDNNNKTNFWYELYSPDVPSVSATAAADLNWQHLAITRKNGVLTMWLHGVGQTPVPRNFTSPNKLAIDWTIGAYFNRTVGGMPQEGAQSLNGWLADVEVWDGCIYDKNFDPYEGRPPAVPFNGPGPQTLIAGDTDHGFFGEVSASELMSYADLKTYLGLNAGVTKDEAGWLKFIHKGVIKFISKTSCWSGITWLNIYNVGALYGTNDTGKFPAVGLPLYNQRRQIKLGNDFVLVPRLISGADEDKTTGSKAGAVTALNNEYSGLMYKVISGVQSQPGKGTLATYSYAEVDMTTGYQLCAETVEATGTAAQQVAIGLVRGASSGSTGFMGANGNTKGVVPSGSVCRMVLELRKYDPVPVPGPQTIQTGNTAQGFYGEVAAGDFITGSALATMVGLTAGTLINDTTNWLKLAYQGKTLFIPKLCIRQSVSWTQMNAAGVVRPESNKRVIIGGQTFLVRLMRGANVNPYTGATTTSRDPAETWGSEFNDLIYNLLAGVTASSRKDPRLASYDGSDLGLSPLGPGSAYICQELYSDPAYCVQRTNASGTIDTIARTAVGLADQYRGWRPVLELIP